MTYDASSAAPSGWFADPTGRRELRYWDGTTWTEHVVDAGVQTVDPLVPAVTDERAASPEPTPEPTPDATREPTPEAAGETQLPMSRRAMRESEQRSEASPVAAPASAASVAAPAVHPPATELSILPNAPSPRQYEPAAGSPGAQAPLPKVPMFGARKFAEQLVTENARLAALIDKHGLQGVDELDQTTKRIEAQAEAARVALAAAHRQVIEANAERDSVAAQVLNLRTVTSIQEFGLYDYENPAEHSVALGTELEALRAEIKQTVQRGHATQATQNFTFNNSAAKGRKFVNDMSKLMLRSYNAEAENCVKAVRAGNLQTAQKRLTTAVTQVERLGGMIDLQITSGYHRLRLKELELTNRHLQAVQHEKELERAHREELREAKKAEQELAREKERLEKERSHYANALAALEAKGDLEGAERLREKLADVDRAITDVDYRAANIRAGYVYVISNVGSFGPEVVKIGLTRRLEPMDRVNELGDASVPFRFDVHALFFADDAVGVESMLHQYFSAQRINKVNLRREYFRVTPAQVLEALKQHEVEVLEYTVEPVAEEFRSSTLAPAG
ncbi:DUF4041 domain-containing protein [Microbacterium sp. P06]|uniref:DUF4041 domain-containing protein n=1 Tax=Microbacterium sp. P06 TaxID=3366949 RepID=UPI003744D4D7